MDLINKITGKFHNFIRFESLNPIDNFDSKSEEMRSVNNVNLFKKAVHEHEELKDVIWIGIYHCLNTFDVDHEYLTVLNSNFQLIADLVEGDERSFEIPIDVKVEILKGNVLATFHNHFKGAVLPSSNDLKNTVLPYVKFMVITSKEIIGIIVNDLDDDSIDDFKQEWIMYISYLSWSFNN
jgi:hypothetical protein